MGLDQEGGRNALVFYGGPGDLEVQHIVHAAPNHSDLHPRAGGTAKALSYFADIQAVHRIPIHFGNHVAGPKTSPVGGRFGKRRDHHNLPVAGLNLHADARVMAFLLLAHPAEMIRIEKLGMRIQCVKKRRDGSLKNRLLRIEFVGVIPLDNGQHIGEPANTLADRTLRGIRRRDDSGAEQTARQSA